MRKSWVVIGILVLVADGWSCQQKTKKKDEGTDKSDRTMDMARNDQPIVAAMAGPPKAGPGKRPVVAGFSDPEVIRRAVAEGSKPRLGSKGFTSAAGPPAQLCTALIRKAVGCRLMPGHVVQAQAAQCLTAAQNNPGFKDRLNVLHRLACDHLGRILSPKVKRGATVKDGQGVGVITDQMLRQLGKDMITEAVARHGRDEAHTVTIQAYCDQIGQTAKQQLGRADLKATCVAVKSPAFNATALGGHVVFYAAALHALQNLAIAQIAKASDLAGYLKYQIALAAHVITRQPLAQWPVIGCAKGDIACRASKLQDVRVKARFDGLMLAIIAHEFGHLVSGHARRKLVRNEVLRVNAAQFNKLTRGKKAQFMNQLGATALSQADEYEADETSLKILQAVWKLTTGRYKGSTGDPLMGPQPMDLVYVALFMQAMHDAIRLLTRKALAPALVSTHPASHARADRALRVIMANRWAGHKLARAAYSMLILRRGT